MSILFQLFRSFLEIGLFSIGGGYAAMPLIQQQVVTEHAWLTMGEFTDLITIAEMTPGPIAVNSATFVGIRIAGIPGACIATFGCILPSLIIVSLLSAFYAKYRDISTMQSILACLRPVIVALIASAGISIMKLVLFGDAPPALSGMNCRGLALSLIGFLVLRIRKWNTILVMTLCGVASLLIYII